MRKVRLFTLGHVQKLVRVFKNIHGSSLFQTAMLFLNVSLASIAPLIILLGAYIGGINPSSPGDLARAQGDLCENQKMTLQYLGQQYDYLSQQSVFARETIAAATSEPSPTMPETFTPAPITPSPSSQEIIITSSTPPPTITPQPTPTSTFTPTPENPCWPLEATISVLQQNVNDLQNTMTALEGTVSFISDNLAYSPTPTATIPGIVVFVEDFAVNTNKWNLPNGVAFINGQLEVSASETGEINYAVVPNVSLSEFTLSVDAWVADPEISGVAPIIVFGTFGENQTFYRISFKSDYIDVYRVMNDQSEFIATSRPPITDFQVPNRLRLNYGRAQIAIYVNEQLVTVVPAESLGTPIGLGGLFNSFPANSKVYFDNLEIRTPASK